MPFNSEEIIQNNLIKLKRQADDDRMDEAQNKLDLYMDDYEAIIKEKMKELFVTQNYDRLKYHVNQSQNIVKRVINEISTIYKAEASRKTNKESKRYEEIKQEVNFDLKLKKVNRYTNLLNECLVKIGVRGGKLVYDIITPNISFVFQADEDPTQADAIVYMRTWVNTRNKISIEYHYWSVEGNYFILNENFRIQEIVYEGDSPYKDKEGKFILPFVVFHRQEPDCDFWDQDSGRDLYNAALMTGVKMTLFDYYFKACSFKQIYIIGDAKGIPQNQIMDPTTALSVPSDEGASIGTLDIQINIEQLRNALIFQINSVINNYGISADQWSLKISEMSGRALKIRNRALLEIRTEQLPLYRRNEKELFEKTRIVNNAWPSLKKISDNLEFSVDFGEIEFPEDPDEKFREDMRELALGHKSPEDLYMKKNPDIKDKEEAGKIIRDNLKSTRELREEIPDLDKYLNAMLKTTEEREEGAAE